MSTVVYRKCISKKQMLMFPTINNFWIPKSQINCLASTVIVSTWVHVSLRNMFSKTKPRMSPRIRVVDHIANLSITERCLTTYATRNITPLFNNACGKLLTGDDILLEALCTFTQLLVTFPIGLRPFQIIVCLSNKKSIQAPPIRKICKPST